MRRPESWSELPQDSEEWAILVGSVLYVLIVETEELFVDAVGCSFVKFSVLVQVGGNDGEDVGGEGQARGLKKSRQGL